MLPRDVVFLLRKRTFPHHESGLRGGFCVCFFGDLFINLDGLIELILILQREAQAVSGLADLFELRELFRHRIVVLLLLKPQRHCVLTRRHRIDSGFLREQRDRGHHVYEQSTYKDGQCVLVTSLPPELRCSESATHQVHGS